MNNHHVKKPSLRRYWGKWPRTLAASILLALCLTNVYIMSWCGYSGETRDALPSLTQSSQAQLVRVVENAFAGSVNAEEQLRTWLAADYTLGEHGDPRALHTQQRCFRDVDESELCEFSGAGLCWDGLGVVALSAKPVREWQVVRMRKWERKRRALQEPDLQNPLFKTAGTTNDTQVCCPR